MSETSSSTRHCNHCNRRVAVETLDDLLFCCVCNSVILPAGDSLLPPPPSPPLSPDRSYEDNYIQIIDILLEVANNATLQMHIIIAEGDGGGRGGAPTAAESAFEALETFEVVSSSSLSQVCAVCIDAMVIGEICKKLPCGHCYHGNCILPWLQKRNSCPLCRSQL
ncbi:E3 ubiquitin-protein ligase CIP8 [Cardamine amara subsp. amara]|uniref:RING-type E3 ubiquitin transferase n=1 Tax=Cardamine amara subsp. amara TaxID=228776 RepID=A0ABD1C4Z9_CARAN